VQEWMTDGDAAWDAELGGCREHGGVSAPKRRCTVRLSGQL